jgi:hypothetical protein
MSRKRIFEIRIGNSCDISCCGKQADKEIIHPQRGTMEVCTVHAENIRKLDTGRFGGVST